MIDLSLMPIFKGQRHGFWKVYNDERIWWSGHYINGREIGYHVEYRTNTAFNIFKENLIQKFYYIR
jgi:hypothetical protein